MTLLLVVAGALFVAYANGANDNFKGVASVYGSGTLGYRAALTWATAATFAGSIAAIVLASGLVRAFSGKGLVPDAVASEPSFLTAVAFGAALTVLLAALLGLPISTTHALTGALAGAGLVATGSALRWDVLGRSFFLPLAVSPVLAVAVTVALHSVLRRFGNAPAGDDLCVCVSRPEAVALPVAIHPSATILATPNSSVSVTWGEASACKAHRGLALVIRRAAVLDVLHIASSGAVSFARGLNDAPKIVGLLVVVEGLRIQWGLAAVGTVMAIGGLFNARRVAETMSKRITAMSRSEGLLSNLTTSCLVLSASGTGLPVSTTHVSCGALFGLGFASGRADAAVVRQILLSWVVTLPTAAAVSALVLMML